MNLQAAPTLDPSKAWVSKALKHDRMLTGCRISPCGTFVAAGGVDAKVNVWELESEKKVSFTGHTGWISGLAFHPDSKRLFSGDLHGMVRCWPLTGGEATPLWSVPESHPGGLRSLAVSRDGAFLMTGGHDRAVRLWSAEDGKLVREFKDHGGYVYTAVFCPDGRSFISGGLFPKIKQWDLESGKLIRELEIPSLFAPAGEVQVDAGGVRSAAFDAKGTMLACAGVFGGGGVEPGPGGLLLDWESGKLKHKLKTKSEGGLDGYMGDIRFVSDSLLIGCAEGSASGGFFFWKLGQEDPFHMILGGGDDKRKLGGSAFQADLHPDGLRVAAAVVVSRGHAGNGGLDLARKGEYFCHSGGVGLFNLYAKPPEAVEIKKIK